MNPDKIISYILMIFFLVIGVTIEGFSQSNDFRKEIEFIGNAKDKEKAIQVVNKSLKRHGNLGVQGDLTVGLNEISREYYITITDKKGYFHVSIAPDSESKHDYCLKVDKNTLEIFDLVIGEVVPEPEPIDEF